MIAHPVSVQLQAVLSKLLLFSFQRLGSNTSYMQAAAATAAMRAYSPRRPASPTSKWQSQSPGMEPELPLEKQMKALHVQEGWQQQRQDKEKVLQRYEQAEQQWPYSPTRQGHMRVPLSTPQHANRPSAAAWDIPAVHAGARQVA